MRVIYNDSGIFTNEMKECFNAEETIYLSSDGEAWLFTNMEVFNEMDNKFQFKNKRDIFPIDLETYIRYQYEEIELNYFGFDICVADYREIVLELIENGYLDIYNNNWDKGIDEHIRDAAMEGLRIEMEETLVKMIDDGWDINELKDAISNALYMRK